MALPITVPYTFGNATTAIPLSNLDSDYATVYQAVNGIGNGSVALANVTISGVSTPITATQGGTGNSSVFTANAVVYAPTTSTLATGSALQFDGANLGLGVTPSANSISVGLDLAGGAGLFGYANQTELTCNAYYSASAWRYKASTYATLYQMQSGQHQWNIASTGTATNAISFIQAMTLDNSGNLLIGATSVALLNNNSIVLNVVGGNVVQNHVSGTVTGTNYTIFGYNTNNIGSITQNGTTGVLYNTSSDQRLKTNIVDAPAGNIDQIKVRSFDWIADNSHQTYGMVAQELVEVAPYAVHQPVNPDEMMGVDYSKLVPMLVKEVQSLRKRIATLENK